MSKSLAPIPPGTDPVARLNRIIRRQGGTPYTPDGSPRLPNPRRKTKADLEAGGQGELFGPADE
jgi:hypothetical protein